MSSMVVYGDGGEWDGRVVNAKDGYGFYEKEIIYYVLGYGSRYCFSVIVQSASLSERQGEYFVLNLCTKSSRVCMMAR